MEQIIIKQTRNKINESIISCFLLGAVALQFDYCVTVILRVPAGHHTSSTAARRRVID